jgi:hypothetical protein
MRRARNTLRDTRQHSDALVMLRKAVVAPKHKHRVDNDNIINKPGQGTSRSYTLSRLQKHREAQSGDPIEAGGESTRASLDDESSARPELDRRSPLGIVSNLFSRGNVIKRRRDGHHLRASPPR